MGACFAAWSQGVLFGKTITRLKAGAAASAARIIATDNNKSMRLMRYLPLSRVGFLANLTASINNQRIRQTLAGR